MNMIMIMIKNDALYISYYVIRNMESIVFPPEILLAITDELDDQEVVTLGWTSKEVRSLIMPGYVKSRQNIINVNRSRLEPLYTIHQYKIPIEISVDEYDYELDDIIVLDVFPKITKVHGLPDLDDDGN